MSKDPMSQSGVLARIANGGPATRGVEGGVSNASTFFAITAFFNLMEAVFPRITYWSEIEQFAGSIAAGIGGVFAHLLWCRIMRGNLQ